MDFIIQIMWVRPTHNRSVRVYESFDYSNWFQFLKYYMFDQIHVLTSWYVEVGGVENTAAANLCWYHGMSANVKHLFSHKQPVKLISKLGIFMMWLSVYMGMIFVSVSVSNNMETCKITLSILQFGWWSISIVLVCLVDLLSTHTSPIMKVLHNIIIK